MTDNPNMGIEFGDLDDDLEAESYPMTTSELLERYGDREVEHANGTVALDEILLEENEETFENPEEVRETVLNMVGEEAVGREGYSDRGGSLPQEAQGEDESL